MWGNGVNMTKNTKQNNMHVFGNSGKITKTSLIRANYKLNRCINASILRQGRTYEPFDLKLGVNEKQALRAFPTWSIKFTSIWMAQWMTKKDWSPWSAECLHLPSVNCLGTCSFIIIVQQTANDLTMHEITNCEFMVNCK